MGNFDLKALIADGKVPNLGTKRGKEQIEYINIDLISDDPNNFYELSGIEELAANIELLGLQQPLRVRTDPQDPARVIIVSGHRRCAAIRMLVDDGKKELAEIPCIRENDTESAALQELRLIYANSDTRKMTSADISRQAERVEVLLYQLKEEGMEFPGRMRDHVAEACKISKSKLARLKVIREGLSPDFADAFEKNILSEQAAYCLARFPLDFQQRIFRVAFPAKIIGGRIEPVLRMYEDGARWEPQFTCPDGTVCTHGDAALRHDLDDYFHCKGEQCCLTCDAANRSWSPCERMCSKAKAQRKAQKEAEAEKDAQLTRRRATAAQRATQVNAQRLLKAIDAAGVSDETVLMWEYSSVPVSAIRDYADGIFGGDDKYWSSERLAPRLCRNPLEIAKKLNCSTDFLLGLVDDPRPAQEPPAEGWVPLKFVNGMEWPPRDGTYYCLFDCEGVTCDELAWWDSALNTWRFSKNGSKVDAICTHWFPLPSEEQPAKAE